MAKAISKPATKVESKASPKKVAVKKTAAKKVKVSTDIEAVSKVVLKKLIALELDPQLQADLEWCLGSYSHDQNPIGLIEALKHASRVFATELARKTKGVTAEFLAEIEEAGKG
jgi:hypothetical protein